VCRREHARPDPPRAEPERPAPAGACAEPGRALARKLRAAVAEQWELELRDGRLVVDFACDRLADPIREIVLEGGAGHGGTLDLVRLRFISAREGWDVLQLRFSPGYFPDSGDEFAAVRRGKLSAASVRPALAHTRAAMHLRAREQAPDPEDRQGGSMSSADVHVRIELVDARGAGQSLAYTGYLGSEGQAVSIAAMEAERPWLDLLDQAALEPTTPDADSRAFFEGRFVAAHARSFHDEFAWWVRERLVGMAGVHGSLALVPLLATQLRLPDDDASNARTRADALESIWRLLGHPVQVPRDEHGGIDEALALAWADACTH
jgi:hypothetical protein